MRFLVDPSAFRSRILLQRKDLCMTKNTDFPDAPIIIWLRNDLRTDDNAALTAAHSSGRKVICVYIFDTTAPADAQLGGAQRWWLHHSLTSFSNGLQKRDAKLILRSGEPQSVLNSIIEQTGAQSVVWNRYYSPHAMERDSAIKATLRSTGRHVSSFDGQLLHEPTQIKTGSGGFYRVYTPFWKNVYAQADEMIRAPHCAPKSLNNYNGDIDSEQLDDWKLLPTEPDWSGGIADEWHPGEAGAKDRLTTFLEKPVESYSKARDLPGTQGTSQLSPHLAFGEISPHRIWHEANQVKDVSDDRLVFLKEIIWREFAYHLLVNVGDLANTNYNKQFDEFPWLEDKTMLRAWQNGMTGYPIVDAGMRQLYQTGWMHNRVRMIVGSFLVKHLLLDWRHGEKWFWDTLVDADPASNAASWQWVAGSGADAAPYFRIFNPMTQGEKFDAQGDYVKLFVPELVNLDKKFIHKPWEAPLTVLKQAGVSLGKNYPAPIVDHKQARQKALDAYQSMRGKTA